MQTLQAVELGKTEHEKLSLRERQNVVSHSRGSPKSMINRPIYLLSNSYTKYLREILL